MIFLLGKRGGVAAAATSAIISRRGPAVGEVGGAFAIVARI